MQQARTPTGIETPSSGFASPSFGTGTLTPSFQQKQRLGHPGSSARLRDLEEEQRDPKKKLLFELLKLYSPNDIRSIQEAIVKHAEYSLARNRYSIDDYVACEAAALALRDRLLESWNDTQQYYMKKDVKRVYYLSLEFLMGRSFKNALTNANLEELFAESLKELGFDLEKLYEQEYDAALGNGGLGRLAACFLDSMATLNIPGWGYGIRYEYGMFRQKIVNGEQVEVPDYWLTRGNPWEIERLDVCYPVRFYGSFERLADGRALWTGGEVVQAVAFDVPVPGYDTYNTNNLRLWKAVPFKEFDLDAFNRADYYKAIEAEEKATAISAVLYPSDGTLAGKELRLKQEYFFVSATLQDAIRRFKKIPRSMNQLPSKVCFQLNDTHPVIAIAEMMRILIDHEGLPFLEALEITRGCFAYTNHTVMPEALEKWSVPLFESLLPRHLAIIYDINFNFLEEVRKKYPGDDGKLARLSIIEEGEVKMVRMAHLGIVGSFAVNGVAELHTKLLKTQVFPEFYELWPFKFQNKTNGITPRRWIMECNPSLTQVISRWLESDSWVKNLSELRGILEHADNPEFQREWSEARMENKQKLATLIYRVTGIQVDPKAMFDVHVKRIHEYKRQLLNILSLIYRYQHILSLDEATRKQQVVPRVVIFAGKAAPGYQMAKNIIRLINDVGRVVNNDERIGDLLKIIFLPNYNVSLAEQIVAAADISQHISTAGTEASGTSNMKFSLNGGLIVGTLDGANIEIREEVGEENIFIFGLNAEQVEEERKKLNPSYVLNEKLAKVLEWIESGTMVDAKKHQPIVDSLRGGKDWYLVGADFESYLQIQEEVDRVFRDQPERWLKMSIHCTAGSGKFSSDRSISEYAKDIWQIEACPCPEPAFHADGHDNLS
ncbi:hypothetical protein GAYE_SCF35G5052 [Galdieria yellowstonensis]|uniref:Alpha-1,4 glucan phosphorylase n=1 Tax=Galdieria yellowstonensis TaxID=3028027 RepID=A0AAV9II51_9RHOD|nr:hypothetical protein GAYE_SCF35G5052 [Galdieria yellowstonensis]